MNHQTDQELLQEYAKCRTDAAFSKLLHRHVDFVCSTAKRLMPNNEHLVKDVTQEVFRALWENAAMLAERPYIRNWLLLTTHFVVCRFMKAETRRHAREQEAAAMTPIFADETESTWQQVAPHLDAALIELPELDREMVMLRYFEGKSFQEIGLLLDVSAQAVQRRVRRGIERLRELLAQRGVTVGTSALGVAISANAIQAAPAGLAVSIASALGIPEAVYIAATTASVSTVTATAAATNTFVMATLHKAIVVTSMMGLLGGVLFGIHEAKKHRAAVDQLAQQQASWTAQMDQKQRELDEKDRQLAAEREANRRGLAERAELLRLRGIVGLLRAAGATPNGPKAETDAWRDRRRRLQARVDQTPEAQVPELQLATEWDWLDASKESLETDQDYRKALSTLRYAAEGKIVAPMQAALNRFMAEHAGQYPTAVEQLAPYFEPPVNPALLSRWKVEPPDEEDAKFGAIGMISQTPVDKEYDRVWLIGSAGHGSSSIQEKEDAAVKPDGGK